VGNKKNKNNNMIRKIAGIILMVLVLWGCGKSETEQFDLKGTIKGKIFTYDEFGVPINDNQDVLVKLEGSEPLLSILTDSTGRYELNDIPTGTYNLVFTKEGYSENQIQGLQVVGGDVPLYYNIAIVEHSGTKIENLSIEIANNSQVYLRGDATHNFNNEPFSFPVPAIRYFIHNSDNPSDLNYLQTGRFPISVQSGSQFNYKIYIDSNLFPSGSTIYLVAYGCSSYEYTYYDILANKYRYIGLGTGSNIASVTVP
jgi:hypothetical protein